MTIENTTSNIYKGVEIPEKLRDPNFRFIRLKSKIPQEKDWVNNNYKFDDPKLLKHLEVGGNYGTVMGQGNLIVVDCDSEEINEAAKGLPETFTVKTGRGFLHRYYIAPEIQRPIRLLKDGKAMGEVGDILAYGKQAVGPNSLHPNGNRYEVFNDHKIASLSYGELREALGTYFRDPAKEGKFEEADFMRNYSTEIKMSDVLSTGGLKQSGKQYMGEHPIHGSSTGMNFWVDPTSDVWSCFRCNSGGGPLYWYAVQEGIIQCHEAQKGRLRGKLFIDTIKKLEENKGIKFKNKADTIIEADIKESDFKVAEVKHEPEFENLLPKDHLISKYMEINGELTDAYPEYHFVSALFMLSLLSKRKVEINVSPHKIYPNLWFFIVGLSTVSRKSTAVKLAKMYMSMAQLSDNLLPDDFTPEALIAELANKPQSGFIRDEVGEFIAKMKKNYQLGTSELFCQIYDNPDYYERKLRKETFKINNLYMPFLAATTPRSLARNASVDDLETGFYSRMDFIWPSRPKKSRRRKAISGIDAQKQLDLVEWIIDLARCIKKIDKIEYQLDPDALDLWNDWYEKYEKVILNSEKGEILSSFFGRLSNDVFKFACLFELGSSETYKNIKEKILAHRDDVQVQLINQINTTHNTLPYVIKVRSEASEPLIGLIEVNQDFFRISKESMKLAIYYATNYFIPSALKVIHFVENHVNTDYVERVFNVAIRRLKDDKKISHSELMRFSKLNARDFQQCIETLVGSGRFKMYTIEGKRTTIYYTPIETDVEDDLPKEVTN